VSAVAALPAAWLAALHAHAEQPPERPRVPLLWRGIEIGSVEPSLAEGVPCPAWQREASAVRLQGEDLSRSLETVALRLREAGQVPAWRNELLAVRDAQGAVLGQVERGVVRLLGIATHAVHLVGQTPDGRHWVQQRSLTKANDPGLWDTLMGGMVPARDTLQEALARETWEEAGLHLQQLERLEHGGQVRTRRPSRQGRGGYIVEVIDWYRCVVPQGVEPRNQDGEVDQFLCLLPGELAEALVAGDFTVEASLVYAAAGLNGR